jgi:hypothetical protein
MQGLRAGLLQGRGNPTWRWIGSGIDHARLFTSSI